MTDARLGDGLWDALARLPRGSGVVFRDYALAAAPRAARFARLCEIARRRGLLVVRAGPPAGRGEDGVHGRARPRRAGLRTYSVHDRREAIAAQRAGADLVFVSPVFATRSHADARPLGRVRLGLLIRGLALPVVALGGMTAARARGLRDLRIHGWAAIDAWAEPQKRNAVPK